MRTPLTIVGVAGIGLIHLLDSVDTFHETRWLFWAYVAADGGDDRGRRRAAAPPRRRAGSRPRRCVALLPLAGYILSRTTGLPGADDDVGNWADPLGLASLWVEGAVLR